MVLFPAPFGPISPKISPRLTSMFTLARARSPPKFLVIPFPSRITSIVILSVVGGVPNTVRQKIPLERRDTQDQPRIGAGMPEEGNWHSEKPRPGLKPWAKNPKPAEGAGPISCLVCCVLTWEYWLPHGGIV